MQTPALERKVITKSFSHPTKAPPKEVIYDTWSNPRWVDPHTLKFSPTTPILFKQNSPCYHQKIFQCEHIEEFARPYLRLILKDPDNLVRPIQASKSFLFGPPLVTTGTCAILADPFFPPPNTPQPSGCRPLCIGFDFILQVLRFRCCTIHYRPSLKPMFGIRVCTHCDFSFLPTPADSGQIPFDGVTLPPPYIQDCLPYNPYRWMATGRVQFTSPCSFCYHPSIYGRPC